MKRLNLWTPVTVSNEDHARAGQAGYVYANSPKHPDDVGVRFDADDGTEVVAIADLKTL